MDENKLHTLLDRLWQQPRPADLWALQAPLLAIGGEAARRTHHVASRFYHYLSVLEHKMAAHQRSQLAAILAAGAVSTVALEDVLTGGEVRLRQLVVAGLAGVLELMSAVQEVQAWRIDTRIADMDASWELYGLLWALSVEMQPAMAPEARAAYIDDVLAPLRRDSTPDPLRVALIVRLFQLVLLARLLALLIGDAERP